MVDLKKVMRIEKRHLFLSVITIVLALIISLLFARGVEGKTYLFHLLERIGGHNLALETNMFGMVAVVLIYLLFLLHKAFYEKLYYIGNKNKVLKNAVFIALGISIIFQFVAGPMQRVILSRSKGLDTVIDQSRISNNSCGFDYDEDGDPSSYGHRVDLINYGSEMVQFYLKFKDFNDPDKTYEIKDESGRPVLYTLKPGERLDQSFRNSEINPDFSSNLVKGMKRQRYHVIIYNDKESHTFITYD